MNRVSLATGIGAIAALMLTFGTTSPAQATVKCWWEGSVKRCQDLGNWQSDRYNNNYNGNYNGNYESPYYNRYDRRYDNRYGGTELTDDGSQYYNNRYNAPYDYRYNNGNSFSIINEIYRAVLGRNADAPGLQTYGDALYNGQSPGWVRERLATSNEARDAVNRVYIQVLGRNADPSGLDTYTRALRNGWTLDRVRQDLASSSEARNYRRQ